MLDFATDTYTVLDTHHRGRHLDAAQGRRRTSYAIPMRGTADNTANSTLTFRMGSGTANVELGIDDVRYSESAIITDRSGGPTTLWRVTPEGLLESLASAAASPTGAGLGRSSLELSRGGCR